MTASSPEATHGKSLSNSLAQGPPAEGARVQHLLGRQAGPEAPHQGPELRVWRGTTLAGSRVRAVSAGHWWRLPGPSKYRWDSPSIKRVMVFTGEFTLRPVKSAFPRAGHRFAEFPWALKPPKIMFVFTKQICILSPSAEMNDLGPQN